MDKKIRKAVRTIVIDGSKILIIQYKTEKNLGYYDLPGGKIEEGETAEEASIRECKEETGIDVINQFYKGHTVVEYPEMIFDFDVFIVTSFDGIPQEFEENTSMWIELDGLLVQEKVFPCIEILKRLDKEKLDLRIYSDENHNVIKVETNE